MRAFVIGLALTTPATAARLGLHQAAQQGQVEPLKVAINGRFDEYNDVWKKPDIDGQNAKGHVALHLALCNKRDEMEVVRVLLEKGADASSRGRDDLTPLHVVAKMCGREPGYAQESFARGAIASAKLLLKHGADANAAATTEKLTPLHLAASGGHVKLVELLLTKGAATNSVDSMGATALHYASRAGNEKAVLALLKAGADASATDGAGRMARDEVKGGDSFSVRIRGHLDRAPEIFSEAVEARKAAKAERAAKKAQSASQSAAEGGTKAEL